jgi:hypothetical protein
MISAFVWILIIGCIIGTIRHFAQSLPRMAKEEKFRRQKEKEYLLSIEKWRHLDMDMYNTLADINPYLREKYYALLPEYRPR